MRRLSRLTNEKKIERYILQGNSVVTLQSGKTGVWYTLRVTVTPTDKHAYKVEALRGSDNTSDWHYIGIYYSDTRYFYVGTPYNTRDQRSWPGSLRAAKYFFDQLPSSIPANLYVYGENLCRLCGRRLTTPESIERGCGPECYKREQERRSRRNSSC